MEQGTNQSSGLTRRGFLAGAGVVAAGVALTGCQSEQPNTPADAVNGEAVDEHIPVARRATATLENAEPIAPEDPPEEWTAEADFVVVGTGGGGLSAALMARDNGASVIVVEKNSTPGGATQHAMGYVNFAGTGRDQIEAGFASPDFPYERDKFLRWQEVRCQFSVDNDLIGNIADAGGECIDWLQDIGVPLVCMGGRLYSSVAASKGEAHNCMAFKEITDYSHNLAEEMGAEFHFNTPCSALITDNGRVVGIKADGPDGSLYFKANKAVILCSGGIGMNPDMLKKYIPTAYESIVQGGPMPYHTGECTRMALGVGADMSGRDSWSCWESEMDNDTGEWVYFWGARQITQLGWLNIDKLGKRCNFYEFSAGEIAYQMTDLPYAQAGQDRARTQVQTSRIGHRAYAIFDGKFEDYMWGIAGPPMFERRPTVSTDPIPEQDLFDTDWRVEFENALEDGRFKQADTLEELAEQLGLDPAVLTKSVDQWNENCANGVDTGTIYPLTEPYLNPIMEPPFYGAKIGGKLGKTLCGLRVDENMRVVNTDGDAIPGLYANFTTAGGIGGESNYGTSLFNTSFLGGNALSWASGYLAAKTALAD